MAEELSEKRRRHRRYFVNISRFYQKRQVRVYTGIVLSILTVTFFLFFAIRPTFVTIAGLLKEIKDKRAINEQLEDKISALNSAQIEYQRISKDLSLIDEALPVDPDLSLFILELEALTRKHNLSLDSLQVGAITLKGEETARATKKEAEAREIAEGMSFGLATYGDYSPLNSFLNTLSGLRRLVFVDAFGFQTSQEGGELILNLNAKAYFLNKKE